MPNLAFRSIFGLIVGGTFNASLPIVFLMYILYLNIKCGKSRVKFMRGNIWAFSHKAHITQSVQASTTSPVNLSLFSELSTSSFF